MGGQQNLQSGLHEAGQQPCQQDLVGRVEVALWFIDDEHVIPSGDVA